MGPKIPVKAQKKVEVVKSVKPVLTGGVTDLGVITTVKREFKAPVIPRSALVPRKERVEKDEVTKPAHWSDVIIPNMFLDSDYFCNIVRTKGKKGEDVIDYDWQIMPGTGGRFPLNKFYVDSEGDLILFGKVGDSYVTQMVMNDENLAKMEALLENSVVGGGVVRRRKAGTDTSLLAEICTLSYGDYNSAFKNAMFGTEPLSEYVYYDRRDYQYTDENGKVKTKYCGALMCVAEAIAEFTYFVKQLGSGKKSLIFNN